MSSFVQEITKKGFQVLADISVADSSLVCTPQELLAWDGKKLQRMLIAGVTKVSRPNGILQISDLNGIQIEIAIEASKEQLGEFFALVKKTSAAEKNNLKNAVVENAPPRATEVPGIAVGSIINPVSEPTTQVEPILSPSPKLTMEEPSSGRVLPPKPRLSDYSDPLTAPPLPVQPRTSRPAKITDARNLGYQELGFSFEIAGIRQRLLARFLDGIIFGIAQRGIEFALLAGVRQKTALLEGLQRTPTAILEDPDKLQTMLNQALQLSRTIPGETLNATVTASILSLLAGWIYYATLESSAKHGTFGKQLAQIGVVDLGLNRISFGQASVRYWAALLPVALGLMLSMVLFAPIYAQMDTALGANTDLLGFADTFKKLEGIENQSKSLERNINGVAGLFLIVSYCWAFFNKSRQTLYDVIAKTLVIKA